MSSTRSLATYIGWVGHGNLGDEASYQAISDLFRDVFSFRTDPSLLRRDVTVLGGGTLMDGTDVYRRRFERQRADVSLVFGAGAESPLFSARPDYLRTWVKLLNKKAWRVCVRGEHSRRWLCDAGLRAPALVCGDPVLNFTVEKSLAPPRSRVLGVNVGVSDNRIWGGSDEAFHQRLFESLRSAVREGWSLWFFPVWPKDVPVSQAMAGRIRESGGQAECAPVLSPSRYVQAVQGIDAFVGEKLHAVALAAAAGRPVVMLEYRPKCAEFMESMGLTDYMIRTTDLNAPWLRQTLERIEAEGESLRASIRERALHWKRQLIAAADGLSAELHEGRRCAPASAGWLAS